MRHTLFIGLLTVLFGATNVAEAGITCTPITLKAHDKNIILPGVDDVHSSQIYLMQNVSKQSLWLDHPNERHRSASAGWSSYLLPGKWSALLVNRKNFTISCAEIQPGKVDYQNCSKAITVCTPHVASFDSKRKGSYWLVEDQSWEDLLKALDKRGVKLK